MTKTQKWEAYIASWIARFLGIGFVWFFVWFLNPPIESSLIWLIAVLFGEFQASSAALLFRLQVLTERK